MDGALWSDVNPSSLSSPRICQLLQRAVAGGFRVKDGQRAVLGGLRPPNVVFNQNSVVEKPVRSLRERTAVPMTPIQEHGDVHQTPPGANFGAYHGGLRPGARSLSPGDAQGGDLWPKLWSDSPAGGHPGDGGVRNSMSVTPTHPWRRLPGGTTDEQVTVGCDTELLPECFISEVVPSPRPQALTPRRWAARALFGANSTSPGANSGGDQGTPEVWWQNTNTDAAPGSSSTSAQRPWEQVPRTMTTPISRRATLESADENVSLAEGSKEGSPLNASNLVRNTGVAASVPVHSPSGVTQGSQSLREPSIKEASQQEPEPEDPLSEPSVLRSGHSQLPCKTSEQEPESGPSQDRAENSGDKLSENQECSSEAPRQAVHNVDTDQIAIIGSHNLRYGGGMAGCLERQIQQRELHDQLWNANESPWAPLGPTFGKAQRRSSFRGRPNSASRKPALKAQGPKNIGPVPGSELQVRSLQQSPQQEPEECGDLTLADLPSAAPKAPRRSSQITGSSVVPTKSEMLKQSGPPMPKDLRKMTRSISPPPTPPPHLLENHWPPSGLAKGPQKKAGPPRAPLAKRHEIEVQTAPPEVLFPDHKALGVGPKLSGRKIITKMSLEGKMNLTSWAQVSLDRNTPEELKDMQYKSALRYHFPGGLTAAM